MSIQHAVLYQGIEFIAAVFATSRKEEHQGQKQDMLYSFHFKALFCKVQSYAFSVRKRCFVNGNI